MTLSINAKLRSSNCVPVTHLTPVGLPSDPRMDTLRRAPAKSGADDLGGSSYSGRSSAVSLYGRLYFVCMMRYGDYACDIFGCAGFLEYRSANSCTVAPIRCLAASGDGSNTLGALPMRNPTRGASAPRHYLFSVVAPSHHHTAIVTSETPQQALSVFSGWFAVPTTDVAISRRQPVQEVAQ